jgi:hypothetical protein
VSRLRTWPSRRDQEWTRRPGDLPPMRMTASWSRSDPDRPNTSLWRAVDRASGELPSGSSPKHHKSRLPQSLWGCGRSASPTGDAPRLPEQARKAGKCSPSPTSPQAPRTTTGLISMETSEAAPPPSDAPHQNPLDTKSPIQVRGLKAHGMAGFAVKQRRPPIGLHPRPSSPSKPRDFASEPCARMISRISSRRSIARWPASVRQVVCSFDKLLV